MTKDGDIGFGVHLTDKKGDKIQVVPTERVECHLIVEEGEILCCATSCTCTIFIYYD